MQNPCINVGTSVKVRHGHGVPNCCISCYQKFVDDMQSCQKHDGDGDSGDFQDYLCST